LLLWQTARVLITRLISPPGITPRHGLRYWQERMFATILLLGLALGIVVFPPSIWLAIREDLPEIVLADTLILGIGIALLVFRRIPFWIRSSTIVLICYLLGLELLVVLGPYGAGPVWLFTAPVLAGALGGTRAAAIALAANAMTIVVFCVLIAVGAVWVSASVNHPMEKWIVIGLNFMLLNALAAVCVALPLRGLQSSLEQEQNAQKSLGHKHEELNRTHGELLKATAERSQAENQLREHLDHLEELVAVRTEDLASTNKELEAFAYSVSHDLRAPLRGIDGFTQILLRDYADKLDHDGNSHLDRISDNARRMDRLIDDLLRLSRLNRTEMRYMDVDLSAMILEIAKNLQSAEPDRTARFIVAEHIFVTGDPTLLGAAMSNLLANAWKFTSHHERATIEFAAAKLNGDVAYYVRDDGAGFDMEYADKLFGAFQRLHDTTEFPGTGVGLATVQRVVHRHGGRIWAEAEVEKGATFYFTLPVRAT
jgi:signal transduction histidine kinase